MKRLIFLAIIIVAQSSVARQKSGRKPNSTDSFYWTCEIVKQIRGTSRLVLKIALRTPNKDEDELLFSESNRQYKVLVAIKPDLNYTVQVDQYGEAKPIVKSRGKLPLNPTFDSKLDSQKPAQGNWSMICR